jgi:hypothetical protein
MRKEKRLPCLRSISPQQAADSFPSIHFHGPMFSTNLRWSVVNAGAGESAPHVDLLDESPLTGLNQSILLFL